MKIRIYLWLIFSVMFIIIGSLMYQFVIQAYEERLLTGQAEVLESQGLPVVESVRGTYPRFPERTIGYMQFYSDRLNARLLLVNQNKHLMYDSYKQIPEHTMLNFIILDRMEHAPVTQFIDTDAYGQVQYTLLPVGEGQSFPEQNAYLHGDYLLIIKDVNEIYEDIRAFRHWVLSLLLIAVMVFFILSYAVAYWFTKPIHQLIDQLKLITPHNRQFQMEYRRKDEIHLLVTSVRDMVAELNQYELRQRQFISSSSHELKTPLATMQLISENLPNVRRDPQLFGEFIADLTVQIEKMKLMTSQLLNMNQMWDKPLHRERLVTAQIVEYVKEHFERSAELQTIQLKVQADEVELYVDHALFYSAMNNLLANALHYSPPASTVTISLRNESNQDVVIQICDQGIGIPKDEQDYIFDPFYRASNATSWNQEGSGIGLAQVKQMVDRHEAEVNVQSEANQGTCFTIRFRNKSVTLRQQS